ncbi:MAG TPA: hypothetical protein VH858_14785 [Hyphomicrobiales bacterium]
MATARDRTADDEITAESGELARHYLRSGGNLIAIIASAMALAFSGISLYETVIKQAHLHVFVPATAVYTRDPAGSFEVFALPVTVSNSGARDGVILSMTLAVRNSATGASQNLEASYFAGPDYFSTKEDLNNNIRRPKTPFAPLSVAGRGSFTGTILFYARKYQEQAVVSGQGRYELVLTAEAKPTEALGVLDSWWSTEIAPQRFVYELPPVGNLFEGRMYSGQSERMFRVE